jgi:hypothetical protein
MRGVPLCGEFGNGPFFLARPRQARQLPGWRPDLDKRIYYTGSRLREEPRHCLPPSPIESISWEGLAAAPARCAFGWAHLGGFLSWRLGLGSCCRGMPFRGAGLLRLWARGAVGKRGHSAMAPDRIALTAFLVVDPAGPLFQSPTSRNGIARGRQTQ